MLTRKGGRLDTVSTPQQRQIKKAVPAGLAFFICNTFLYQASKASSRLAESHKPYTDATPMRIPKNIFPYDLQFCLGFICSLVSMAISSVLHFRKLLFSLVDSSHPTLFPALNNNHSH